MTALILVVPYPLALAVIAGIPDLIPNVGATIAGIIVALVALSVSLEALIAFGMVMVVYQQVENYILQPSGRRRRTPAARLWRDDLAQRAADQAAPREAEEREGGPVRIQDATLLVEQHHRVSRALEHGPEQRLPAFAP